MNDRFDQVKLESGKKMKLSLKNKQSNNRMGSENPENVTALVLNELKLNGVLCPSQLSVHLGYGLEKIKQALDFLLQEGLIELRKDLGEARFNGLHEIAYGLNRGKLKYLSPSQWFVRKVS
ncbi:MAG: hypothetical protein ACE5HS_10035 [bacterium]